MKKVLARAISQEEIDQLRVWYAAQEICLAAKASLDELQGDMALAAIELAALLEEQDAAQLAVKQRHISSVEAAEMRLTQSRAALPCDAVRAKSRKSLEELEMELKELKEPDIPYICSSSCTPGFTAYRQQKLVWPIMSSSS